MININEVFSFFSKLFNEYMNRNENDVSFQSFEFFFRNFINENVNDENKHIYNNSLLIFNSYYHVFLPILDATKILNKKIHIDKHLVFTFQEFDEAYAHYYKNKNNENFEISIIYLKNRNIFYNEIWIKYFSIIYVKTTFCANLIVSENYNKKNTENVINDIKKSLSGIVMHCLGTDIIPIISYTRMFLESLFKEKKEKTRVYMEKANPYIENAEIVRKYSLLKPIDSENIEVNKILRSFLNNTLHSDLNVTKFNDMEYNLKKIMDGILYILIDILFQKKIILEKDKKEFESNFPLMIDIDKKLQ